MKVDQETHSYWVTDEGQHIPVSEIKTGHSYDGAVIRSNLTYDDVARNYIFKEIKHLLRRAGIVLDWKIGDPREAIQDYGGRTNLLRDKLGLQAFNTLIWLSRGADSPSDFVEQEFGWKKLEESDAKKFLGLIEAYE